MKKETSWGAVASWYDELLSGEDTYQKEVILPNLMRVLALTSEERVIDIACGQGFFARACKEAGAKVTGIDISKELITLASKESRGISYHVAPSTALPVPTGSFTTALMILAVQNIADADGTFAEAERVTTPSGRLVIVMNHPAFRVPKRSNWQYDEKEDVQYRRVARYLSGERASIDMHPGKRGSAQTVSYHRSLQDIAKSLRKNGFLIARLEEWISHRESGKGPRKNAEDTARKEIPLFMLLEAVKRPGPFISP